MQSTDNSACGDCTVSLTENIKRLNIALGHRKDRLAELEDIRDHNQYLINHLIDETREQAAQLHVARTRIEKLEMRLTTYENDQ